MTPVRVTVSNFYKYKEITSAYGGGFIHLFQHYFSSDTMSIKNLTVGNIAQKTKRLHSELKHTLWQTKEVVHPKFKCIWKIFN